jgi:hypothetical protein
MMMNNQNMTVFNVELGFTALPHLPDLPARGVQKSAAHQIKHNETSTGVSVRILLALTH